MSRGACAALAAGLALFFGVVLPAMPARAHELRPGVASIREVAPDSYRVAVVPALAGGGAPLSVAPERPAACAGDAVTWTCPEGPPTALRFERARGTTAVTVVVSLVRLDGAAWGGLLRPGSELLELAARPRGAATAGPTILGFFTLGLEHVLIGPDHVLLIAGLLLVAVGWRSLLLAVTGFTLGHGLSVTAAAMRWVPSTPEATELVIALSLVALGREALVAPKGARLGSLAAVSVVFGVVHGFGFGGALVAVGLPSDGAALALLAFNVGVEAAQLVVLSLLAAALFVAGRLGERSQRALGTATAWVIGTAGAFWTIERALRWLEVVT